MFPCFVPRADARFVHIFGFLEHEYLILALTHCAFVLFALYALRRTKLTSKDECLWLIVLIQEDSIDSDGSHGTIQEDSEVDVHSIPADSTPTHWYQETLERAESAHNIKVEGVNTDDESDTDRFVHIQ